MPYATTLTDSEWEIITSIHSDNRQRKYSLRQHWDAIFYIVKTGCQWRYLPTEFAPWQTVKTTHSGPNRGFDGGKRVKGRKRHIIVDTLGLLLAVVVTAANVQDKRGLPLLLAHVRDRFERLTTIFVDGGYRSQSLSDLVERLTGYVLTVVPRQSDATGFVVLPKRWIVERTFGWFNNYRRLSKDYEYRVDTSETMVYLAMIRLMLKRSV